MRYATLGTLAYLPTAKLVLVGTDFRAFDDGRYFLISTSALSFATARTKASSEASESYQAFDVRLGVQFGVELARVLRPYAAARVFGGPVFWRYRNEAVTGTDVHHYQLGAGLAVRVSKALNLFAEGFPLGEQAVAVGVGLALC